MSMAQQAVIEQEIVKMYEAWAAAIREGDSGWFRRNLVDDFIYVDLLGSARDLENVIRMEHGRQGRGDPLP